MEDLLRVGVISSTHGVKGEVKVFPTTDDMKRFETLKTVMLENGLELEIEQVRFFKQMVILKFKGYDTIHEIEKYRGQDLLISRKDAVPLEENEYFIFDIIGLSVVTEEGEKLGIVKEILQTGANDVYVVQKPDGKEILLPSIPECILQINLEEKVITVHLMDGLVEE